MLSEADASPGVEAAQAPKSSSKPPSTKESRRERMKREKKKFKEDIWKIFEDADKERQQGMGRVKSFWWIMRRVGARLKEENARLARRRRGQEESS